MPEHASVQPPLRYIAPRFNRPLFRIVSTLYPLYLRFGLGIRSVAVDGIGTLVDQYRQFQQGKTRLVVAFRHPHLDDGALMAWLLGGVVRRAANREHRRTGSPRMRFPTFAHFVYDRGVALWAGPFIAWLLPRMGAIPVYRAKLDSLSLEEIRRTLLDADQPLAIAPEGAVTYSERHAAPLESGVAHFVFWCVRDLIAAGRSENVVVVPVVPIYRHGEEAAKGVAKLIAYLERECGLEPAPGGSIPGRLRAAADCLLRTTEHFYKRFYSGSATAIADRDGKRLAGGAAKGTDPDIDGVEQSRIESIVEAALASAEHRLGLSAGGGPIPRVRRIEQACWDRIYREDIGDISALSPLGRALADRIALETSLVMRHLQLADLMVYLRKLAIPDTGSLDELAEVASNLVGVIARLKGGDVSATPRIGSRSVVFRVGAPIPVIPRWDRYRSNRQESVDELTSAIEREFQRLSSGVQSKGLADEPEAVDNTR